MKETHDMNKESGYYQGPDGVFYDFKYDKIFELIWRGKEVYRKDVGIAGKIYVHAINQTDAKNRADKTVLTGMDNVIRLGDL